MAYLDRTTVVVNLLLPLLIAVPVELLLLAIRLVAPALRQVGSSR